MLSAILDVGTLRIRDVMKVLGIERQSINALMQYLKRKELVRKNGEGYNASYLLTDKGHTTLLEMTRRRAA